MSEQKKVLTGIREFQKDMEGVEIIKATEAYGYYYATLKDILDVIHPILRKNELWYQHSNSFDATSGNNTLNTIVYSTLDSSYVESNTLIDGDATLAKMNKFMVEGSAITYFRRYHITTLLGLTTDEDTDAAGKRVTKKAGGQGRSVESAASAVTKPNFIDVFSNLLKTKTEIQINKTFEAYKSQMDNDEIVAVTKLISEKFNK